MGATRPSPLGEGGRRRRSDEGEPQTPGFSLISHAPRASFSQGRSGALALALLLAPAAAQACSCKRIAPEGFRQQADAIVEGRVVDVRRDGGINGRVTARIAVTRQVKGRTSREVSVRTRGNSAACGVVFTAGQRGEFLLVEQNGGYTTNLCLMLGARR